MPHPSREAVGGGRVFLPEGLLAPDGHSQKGETQLQKTAISPSKKQQAIKRLLHTETCIKANHCTSVNVIATPTRRGPCN